MKRCTTCNLEKPLSAFSRDNRARGERAARGGMGVVAQCKECVAEARKPGITAERAAKEALAHSGLKCCGRCKVTKPLTEFAVRRASPDGLAHRCRVCAAEVSRKWRRDNPDGFRQWHEANKEHRERYWRASYENNKQHRSASYKAWAKANPGIVNALIAKRIAAKKRATVPWADVDAIQAIYVEASRLTRETGIKHEVDHIYPLQGNDVSGLHVEANLQILTKVENIRKGNRLLDTDP